MSEDLRRPLVAAVEEHDSAVVVRTAGELDLYNADELRRTLGEVCARTPERVVVDLSELSFIDSTGLGVLVEGCAKLPNRALLLAAPQREIRRALEITGLDRHFGVYDTVEEALAAPLA
jgi:anti-sigma B factor antagonist